VSDTDDPKSKSGNSPQPPMSIGAFDTFFWSGGVESPRGPNEIGHLEGWTLIRQIGSGGMGVVFESRDPETGAPVAIKLLKPELVNDSHSAHRFIVEARHMHQMSHPNILRVVKVLERADGPCYVMPYITGGALSSRLHPGEPMKTAEILRIGRQIASALVYAHDKGIIHRDLKPANVLLDENNQALLCDFGLVRTVFNDSISDVGRSQREGTATYMSPAMAAGQAEDTRCDIYSFGAMLYEMLVGRLPYEGRNSDEIVQKVQNGPPESISKRNPRAPAGLVKIAEGCMARQLRDRYAQMADVLADLDRVFSGASPIGPHGHAGGIRRRHLIAAAILLVIAIAGLSALWRHSFAQRPGINAAIPPMSSPAQHAFPTSTAATKPSVATVSNVQPTASPVTKRIQELLDQGTEVVLDGLPVTDADLAALDGAKHVTVVSLRDTRITDAGLIHLQNLTDLAELRLVHTAITGSGFEYLERLQYLTHLLVNLCPITDASLVHLQKLPNLRYLHLAGTRVTDAGLQALRTMTQLRQIDLPGRAITDAGLEPLAALTNMEILSLRSSRVTDDGMHLLRNMQRLSWLDLQGTRVHGHGLADLMPRLTRLQTLVLNSTPLDEAAMAALAADPALRTLNVQNTPFDDSDLKSLSPLTNLESLGIGGTKVSDAGLATLTEFPRLAILDLSSTSISDAGLVNLQGLARLSDLNLTGTAITDAGLEKLAALTSLRRLSLIGTHVTDAGVDSLQRAVPDLIIRR
jgi:serine/threonine protein kinase/Leucine-rich repeat (LRR) protein